MKRLKVPIRPAGMMSDVTENELQYRHDEVTNLKEIKKGEWEIVPGWINAAFNNSGTNIKAAIEVSDDLSGDRFILAQEGTTLYRINYDISASPLTGYEAQALTALTLPDGVTIGANDTLRFFVHNGIVRISGATVPLWYGYIKGRRLFYKGYQDFYHNGFENVNDILDLGTSGTSNSRSTTRAWKGTYSARIIDSVGGGNGYTYLVHAVTEGNYYNVSMHIYKAIGQNADHITVKVGTTQGGAEIDEKTLSQTNVVFPANTFEFNFKAETTGNIYVSIYPYDGDEVYMDEYTVLEDAPQITITDGWYLEKAGLQEYKLDVDTVNTLQRGDNNDYPDTYSFYLNSFYKYDKSQYSILDEARDIAPTNKALWMNESQGMFRTPVRVPGEDLLTSLMNNRLTGFGVAFNRVNNGLPEDDATSVWRVGEFVDFSDQLPRKTWVKSDVYYDSTYPKRLQIINSGSGFYAIVQEGYIQIGQKIRINNFLTEVANWGTYAGSPYIEITDNVDPYLRSGTGYLADDSQFILYRGFDYDASLGFTTYLGLDLLGSGAGAFTDFAGFPASTTDNNPDYTHHLVVDNRPYCLSNEDQEQDTIRYGPVNQFDNFPVGNIVQTPVGDIDQNLGLIERDSRFIALKRHSISQGQFTSSSYFHDKKGKTHGIYATEGYIVINDILYFMDDDDVYLFAGVQIEPWLEKTGMRELYRQYVSTDSFFAYNSDDNELWLCLNGLIIAYDFTRNSFYLRNLGGVTLRGAIRTYDNKLHVFEQYGFLAINHDETTYDQIVNASFKTRLIDLNRPDRRKQLRLLLGRLKSSSAITVTVGDANESTTSVSGSYTPDTNKVDLLKITDIKYIFRELYLQVAWNAVSYAKTGTMKSFDLIIRAWK